MKLADNFSTEKEIEKEDKDNIMRTIAETCCQAYRSMLDNDRFQTYRIITSFVNKPEFIESKRFQRYVEQTTDKLAKYVTDNFKCYDSETRQEVKKSGMAALYNFFGGMIELSAVVHHIGNRVKYSKAVFEYDESLLEVNETNLSNVSHKYYCRPIWVADRLIAENEDDDVCYSVPNVIAGFVFENKDDFLDIMQTVISECCLDYIREVMIDDASIGEDNWFAKSRITTDSQTLKLLIRVFGCLCAEVESAAFLAFECRDPDTAFSASKTMRDYKKKIQQLDNKLEKQKEKYDTKTQELKKRNSELSSALTKSDKQAKKQEKAATTNISKELESERKRYSELEEKYKSLLEYTELLKPKDEEAEIHRSERFVFDDDEYATNPIRSKRIVFVRDKEHENYVIMKRLADYFPNSKFTNVVAGDINAQTTDVVVLLTKYVCHGTYWSAKKNRIKGVQTIHCAYSSLEGVIDTIRDSLKKK